MEERDIIRRIEKDLKIQYEDSQKAASPGELDSKWGFLTSSEPGRFINPNMTLKVDILRNFRRLDIFITDTPSRNRLPIVSNFLNYIIGGRRGVTKLLKESHTLLEENNYLDLLRKYPVSRVGNPNIFKYKGCVFTFRWVRHLYFLGLFKEVLQNRLNDNFTCLDIGSSYGIFSSLLKKEYTHSCHVLLDFPEQLVLAHYFLGVSLPEARIAGYKEVSAAKVIDRDFLEKYDFILLPWFFYKKLAQGSIDLVTNFASFGEMKREWFGYYLKSEPFLSTKYFYTVNRFQSAPTYDTDLTILDYPLNDFKKLHFRISPYFSHIYMRKYLFFYEKYPFSSQYFEFIGERP